LKHHEVVIQPAAADEIDAAFRDIAAHAALETAQGWFNELDDRLQTLATMPRRCPIAPESDYFDEEIRQLLVNPYRVLFTISGKRVHVLHVRHTARRTIGEPET
jgi:plasmid stabilization system protein ParE